MAGPPVLLLRSTKYESVGTRDRGTTHTPEVTVTPAEIAHNQIMNLELKSAVIFLSLLNFLSLYDGANKPGHTLSPHLTDGEKK